MKNIYLKVPSINELHYGQEWMNDPKTMSYNAGYDIDLKGYDKNTGTIIKYIDERMIIYNILDDMRLLTRFDNNELKESVVNYTKKILKLN